jgi:glycosyltransferase involved in cell wall biosynthesis
MAKPIRILHAHSTFSLGGKEARAVRLMNAFGGEANHVVLSGVPGALGAREAIDPAIDVAFPADHPSLTGRPSLARYRALAAYMRGFDLVLSYNWGAMDAVMARRLFGGPPLVHHEDGFNADEANGQKRERILFRRLALPGAARLVVPSVTLERIARRIWRQPDARIKRIANGVPVARFAAGPSSPIAGLERRPGELIVGTLAGLRSVKNLPLLVQAFADALGMTDGPARLVIVGEGPEREAIVAAAREAGIADRVLLPGFMADPARYIGHFDIFALSSDSEQLPISLIEAMAAGLPVAATAVGDVAETVAEENRPLLCAPGARKPLAEALARLLTDSALRERLGEANRRRAELAYSEDSMIAAYRTLYADVLGPSRGQV